MPKRVVALPRSSDMELDIVSYGRRGPGTPSAFNAEQVEQIQRTVNRTAEVMVKVSGGARDVGAARAHLRYIDRHGKLEIVTDEGVALNGRGAADRLVNDWQLDLDRSQYRPKPLPGERDTRAKLVHNIVLSMPAGTPPQKVLAAAQAFARENFALRYRYAMVLHTDQAHPHVHLAVKCVHEFEPGKRLYIRKETLRVWREQFAALMREQGVPANATPRQLRGARRGLKDPIHHRLRDLQAASRGSRPVGADESGRPKTSHFMLRRLMSIVKELQTGQVAAEAGAARLAATRAQAVAGWQSTAETLDRQGMDALARQVKHHAETLPAPLTDRALLRERLRSRLEEQLRARDLERDRSR